jgi:hypothetical protein
MAIGKRLDRFDVITSVDRIWCYTFEETMLAANLRLNIALFAVHRGAFWQEHEELRHLAGVAFLNLFGTWVMAPYCDPDVLQLRRAVDGRNGFGRESRSGVAHWSSGLRCAGRALARFIDWSWPTSCRRTECRSEALSISPGCMKGGSRLSPKRRAVMTLPPHCAHSLHLFRR